MKDKSLKTTEEVEKMQDIIFREMSVEKKIKITSDLSSLCLKLNSLNGNIKSGKATYRNS